jgi:hypothetical protein
MARPIRIPLVVKSGAWYSVRRRDRSNDALDHLRLVLDETAATDRLAFLLTEKGKPFSDAGFGNWFRDRCNEAGIPTGYSTHGVRKYAATEHANRGATAHELMAWFGWLTFGRQSATPALRLGGNSRLEWYRSSQREHEVTNAMPASQYKPRNTLKYSIRALKLASCGNCAGTRPLEYSGRRAERHCHPRPGCSEAGPTIPIRRNQ